MDKCGVILGAGIAGALAYGYFRVQDPAVYEKSKSTSVEKHKAIMRVKSPIVGRILGCNSEKIFVTKEVYFEGQLFGSSNIMMKNLYSLKISGSILERSISDLRNCERYLLEETRVPALYEHEFIGVDEESCLLKFLNHADNQILLRGYPWCISTLPMPILLKLLNIDVGIKFKVDPIYVLRREISFDSKVNQTIYFPEAEKRVYRATLQKKLLIIESYGGYPCDGEVEVILSCFGILEKDQKEIERKKQNYGKLVSIDDDIRKAIIMELTDKYRIYSLGRFAVWKNVRTDDLISDLKRIKEMITVSAVSAKYINKLR